MVTEYANSSVNIKRNFYPREKFGKIGEVKPKVYPMFESNVVIPRVDRGLHCGGGGCCFRSGGIVLGVFLLINIEVNFVVLRLYLVFIIISDLTKVVLILHR